MLKDENKDGFGRKMNEQKTEKPKKKPEKMVTNKLVVTKDEFLKLKPIINPFVRQKENSDEILLLEIDLTEIKKKSLIRRIFPTPNTKKIQLDKLGKFVFLLCDGDNNVQNIMEKFQSEYRLTPMETEVSIQKYLMSLTERHLIGFMIPKSIIDKNPNIGKMIEKVIVET